MNPISKTSRGRTRIKTCGTTRFEDAALACELGVDALGFIFFAKSPRNIEYRKAAEIIQNIPPMVERVGVFVDALDEDLEKAIACGLSCLQLHGKESPKRCDELRRRFPSLKIIKAFRVGDASRVTDFSVYNDVVDCFLLDTYVKGAKGGTGEVFDWQIIDRLELSKPYLLAGGLSPENLTQALDQVRPFGVDINSGVEVSPGIKDHRRLRDIFRLLVQADGHKNL